ncbi:hypothetical protein FPOA_06537 [Fusarium poae]|uniref:NAD-dependent epimerase/dehydratase domain-containing protein n=1 Tax=Fusarium poae TaxID=36050 RepID=A0A1B8AZZ8_FUSPO|nr:hypothetical protein FPOA_06537 [Fusarium poae]
MSQNLVFITGATGFIGAHVATQILQAGYRVRLSVRQLEQIQKLKHHFNEFPNQLDFVHVPDFTKPNAFKEAVRDVHFVVHIASPMLGQGSDFKKDYIDPAVEGTISVLNAAKSEPSIHRVLVMSSILALMPLGGLQDPSISIRENSGTKLEVDAEMNVPAGPAGNAVMYQGSKILAHEKTKEWVLENIPAFSLYTFHPTFVIGPSIFQQRVEQIDSINKFFLDTVRTGNIIIPPLFVDVRDVADAFVKALAASIPVGQEFILTGQPTSWAEIGTEVKALYPDAMFELEATAKEGPPMDVVPQAANQFLNIKWKSLTDLVQGVLDQQLALEAQAV